MNMLLLIYLSIYGINIACFTRPLTIKSKCLFYQSAYTTALNFVKGELFFFSGKGLGCLKSSKLGN